MTAEPEQCPIARTGLTEMVPDPVDDPIAGGVGVDQWADLEVGTGRDPAVEECLDVGDVIGTAAQASSRYIVVDSDEKCEDRAHGAALADSGRHARPRSPAPGGVTRPSDIDRSAFTETPTEGDAGPMLAVSNVSASSEREPRRRPCGCGEGQS